MNNNENLNANPTEEKKVNIIMEGMDKEQIVIANELIFKLDQQKELYEKQVQYFEDMIERLENEYWFIDASTIMKKQEHSKDERKKYSDYKETQLKGTESSLQQYQSQLSAQRAFLKKTSDFLFELNDHIDMSYSNNPDERIAIYDKKYFEPIIKLCLTIGYLDYEYEEK